MHQMAWGTDAKLSEYEFYNRKEDIRFISNLLKSSQYGSSPTILITGLRGVGKTALIKKLEEIFNNDYLVTYIDLTESNEYQSGKLKRIDVIKIIYDNLLKSCESRGIRTINQKLKKFLKTNDIHINNIVNIKDIPVPLITSEENYSKLSDFVLNLPQEIYNENNEKIKGVIVFIDEVQVLKDLNDELSGFLWYLRSKIQFQKNVTYIFSGSMSTKDTLIDEIAGSDGAFGGRILTIEIKPFSYNTTKSYIKEKMPQLEFTESGLKRLYKCTNGIPFYINNFVNLLPENRKLDEEAIIELFNDFIPVLITPYLITWGKLPLREQKIITSLLDKPLKRIEIADKLGVTSGSLGRSLNHLLDLVLIEYDDNMYKVIDPVLRAWLKNTYKKRGIYPYRSMLN